MVFFLNGGKSSKEPCRSFTCANNLCQVWLLWCVHKWSGEGREPWVSICWQYQVFQGIKMKADCQELQEDLVKVAGNKEANQILVDKLSRLWVKVFTSLCEVVRMEGRTTPSCVWWWALSRQLCGRSTSIHRGNQSQLNTETYWEMKRAWNKSLGAAARAGGPSWPLCSSGSLSANSTTEGVLTRNDWVGYNC